MKQDSILFIEKIKEKKVLFVTTKNIDYIRNTQEISLLKKNAKEVVLIYSQKKSYVGRIMEIWRKLFFININGIDVVFIGFAPQLVLPFFKLKLRKKEIIIDFFISVYDTLIHDRKKFKDKGFIARVCHIIDAKTLKYADYVLTDTKADAQYFVKEFHGDQNKFETLYLEADRAIYYPREQHKRKDLLNKFVVLYFGSILPLQGVNVVLEAVCKLKEEKNIFFQIIGPISEKYQKPIQDNVEYIDWLGQKALAEYIANADLCLAGHFCGDIDKAKRTIPGKAFIYDAMGKRMILGDNEANRELENMRTEVMVTQGDSSLLAEQILNLYHKNME